LRRGLPLGRHRRAEPVGRVDHDGAFESTRLLDGVGHDAPRHRDHDDVTERDGLGGRPGARGRAELGGGLLQGSQVPAERQLHLVSGAHQLTGDPARPDPARPNDADLMPLSSLFASVGSVASVVSGRLPI
jgi:hypothetical protein